MKITHYITILLLSLFYSIARDKKTHRFYMPNPVLTKILLKVSKFYKTSMQMNCLP